MQWHALRGRRSGVCFAGIFVLEDYEGRILCRSVTPVRIRRSVLLAHGQGDYRPQFDAVMLSCRTVAIDTQTKYGT